jgi:hypothetical protein
MQSTPNTTETPFKQCGILTAVLLGLFAVLYVPAQRLVGPEAVEGLTYATLLCLIPGLILFPVVGFLQREASPVAVMGISTMLRLMTVGIGALVILKLKADFGFPEFLIWLLICYFASLLVETLLLVR